MSARGRDGRGGGGSKGEAGGPDGINPSPHGYDATFGAMKAKNEQIPPVSSDSQGFGLFLAGGLYPAGEGIQQPQDHRHPCARGRKTQNNLAAQT